MKKFTFILVFTQLIIANFCIAQSVAINNDGSVANTSAMLYVKSTVQKI
jgi:hypothetical protein